MRDDIRVALRRLRQQPVFSLVVVLTLALGLGANIAIFTLINALTLRPLPVHDPQELYRLGDTNDCCVNSGWPRAGFSLFSSELFQHLRANLPEFAHLAGFQANLMPTALRRSGMSVSQSVNGEFVTANYFQMFGVSAAAGRMLQPDDDGPGAAPVAVLSYRAWSRYGFDPSVVGAPFAVNGMPMTVVGVAPAEFFGDTVRPDPADVWLPMGQEPAMRGAGSLIARADQNWLYGIGRLKPDAQPAAVSARATTSLQQWLSAQSFIPDAFRDRIRRQYINVTSAKGGIPLMQGQYGRSLSLLLLTSAVLLLIACANLANMLLARADHGQAAIRTALGASAWRLIRQSLTEGLVLALIGAAIGIVIAVAGANALIEIAFPGVRFMPAATMPSATGLAFAAVLAVVTAAVFTGAPAWIMARSVPLVALSATGRGGLQSRSLLPRRSLLVTQVALSFAMVTAALLLASSLRNLEHQRLGFDPADRWVVRIDPAATLAGDRERLTQYYERLQDRLRRVPGVVHASYALYSPMEGNNWSSGIAIGGRAVDPARPDSSSWNRVGPDYFATVGTRVLRGRGLDERDTANARHVCVVNDGFVRQFFPNSDPIGRTVGIGGASHAGDFEIVGVVDDVKYVAAAEPVRPMIFLPAFQVVAYADASAANMQTRSTLLRAVVVQVAPGATNVEAALRQAVGEVDADLNVMRVLPMSMQVSVNFRVERLMARATTTYGLLALLLASLGLYGVTSYSVAQRTREIGVRMALGADRVRIMRNIVRRPAVDTMIGLALGIPLAVIAGNALSAQLFGLGGRNPRVMAAAVAILVVTAILAAAVPARRATAIDPAQALRGE